MSLLLESIDELVQEVRGVKTKVVRQGKMAVKFQCPAGFKTDKDGNCVRMTAQEKKSRSKAALKSTKIKSRKGAAAFRGADIMRSKSMKVRSRFA